MSILNAGKKALFASLAMAMLSNVNATEFLDPPTMATPKSITVFVAKRVVTMDPSNPTATAVAVSDGKILSVGSLEDLKPWTDKYPTQINREFADKVIYPGFIDPHEHPLIAGITTTRAPTSYFPLPSPWGKTFPGVKTVPAAIAQLKKYSADMTDPNETLVSWGYDIAAMKVVPTGKMLDEVSLTRPVVLWDSSEHNLFLNAAAVKKYITNIDEAKKVFGVGVNPDGTLNGQFLGFQATQYGLLRAGKDVFTEENVIRGMLHSNDMAQQGGITTTSEMTFGIIDIELEKKAFQAVTSSNTTSLRITPVAYGPSFVEKYGDQAPAQVKALQSLNTDRLLFKGVKFIDDDAYQANTMKVANPGYTDGHQGLMFYPTPDKFASVMKPWWDAGFQIHVHTNGDAGNQNVLNALQILQDEKPRFDHRFTMEHFGMPTTAMVRKLKVLGGAVSANPSYFYIRGEVQAPEQGYDRSSYATRMGELVHEGVPVAMHTDYPCSPPQPLQQVWAAVNRQNLFTGDKKWAPAEAVTTEQALKMVTSDAAYVLGLESKVGSIEPGKYADFAVLGDDPLTVNKQKIKDIKVFGTVLGGRYIPVSETSHERPL